jgi:hypothetical protein
MAKKPYQPVAPYSELKRVETALEQATTVDTVRQLVTKDGPKIGYKAFCYMLGGKMSAAEMKPDEACTAAFQLEQEGDSAGAVAIYQQVLKSYPEHPIAKAKVQDLRA